MIVACCVVCVTILLAILIGASVFVRVTEKKQEEMTRREEERSASRQAKYRNEIFERQLLYGYPPAEEKEGGLLDGLAELATPENLALIGQLLGNRGGGASPESFPGDAAAPGEGSSGSSSSAPRVV